MNHKNGIAFHSGASVFHPERTKISLFFPAEGKLSENLKNLVFIENFF